jgi:hypothetical protein
LKPDGKPAQRRATVNVHIDGKLARRASPLWLRVHHDGKTWRLRSLAFFDEWLPAEPIAKLRISSDRGASKVIARPSVSQIRAELNRWFETQT